MKLIQSAWPPAMLAATLLAGSALAQSAPATPPATTPPAVTPPPPVQPKPFKEVVKDAKEIPGFFTLHQKDDKIWIELRPEQLDMPFYLAFHRTHGLGERGIEAPFTLRPAHIAQFRKIGNQIQLIATNARFTARPGTPMALAVRQGFSDSLLASAGAASTPHPDSKAILVEANALLLTDIPGGATTLETAFRMPFAYDARNSSFTQVRNEEDATNLNIMAHYSVPKLAAPPLPGTPAVQQFVPPPRNSPDPRSVFLGYHVGMSKLPEPMTPRVADDRIGHFTTMRWDFATDTEVTAQKFYVNRWRLEKQDPAAALSEPRKPIVFTLDKNIPEQYRPAVTAGILEWNKAFERIGFKDAVRVRQQGPDDNADTSATRTASVRWLTTAEPQFGARGPSHTDPRTGEILDADIEVMATVTRNQRRNAAEVVPRVAHEGHAHDIGSCDYASLAAQELDFALDVLEARGEFEPDSPQAEAFVAAYLKDLMMHEVGHTLGLRHNYRASSIYSLKQLSDKSFTAQNALSGSVMEYLPINLATKDEPQADFFQSTLGPYDYWVIEYAYRPLDAATEKEALERIAARSHEPQLAYATDEDAGFGGAAEGVDPDINRFDLGTEPLAWHAKRLKLTQELWERMQTREFKAGEGYQILRRNVQRGLTQIDTVSKLAAKYVGGVRHVRDHAGSGRNPFTPVPAAEQREALKLIAKGLFSTDSFRFKPEFLSRLSIDYFNRTEIAFRGGAFPVNPAFSLPTAVLTTQRAVLDQLMSDWVATRVLDADLTSVDKKKVFTLAELYDTVQAAIWSELKGGTKDVDLLRRNLQREHTRIVANALVKPAATMPPDARSLLRENARSLVTDLRVALAKPGLSKEMRAHLSETQNTLEEALKASLQRAAI